MINPKLVALSVPILAAASLAACSQPAAKPAADTGKIADAVKADVHQMVSDLNAHDAAKAVSHDAPDIVGMFHGAPNIKGPEADLAMTKQIFVDNPNFHLDFSDESVDVASAGDMAVYRGSYVNLATDPKTKKPMTETGNFVAGYKPQADGAWKMTWSVVSDAAPAPPVAPAAK